MQDLIYMKVEPYQIDLMEQIYRLRYEVYVEEFGFVPHDQCSQRLEKDEYDPQAVHFAALDPSSDRVVASMRLIIPGRLNIPLQKRCRGLFWLPRKNKIQQTQWGEISRFVIAKDFRRSKTFAGFNLDLFNEEAKERLFQSHGIAAGLCKEIYEESVKRGVTHWGALMEKGLWGLLRIYGFHFQCIGEEIDVAGPVRPYMATVKDIQKAILKHGRRFQKRKFVLQPRVFLPQPTVVEHRFA